MYVRQQILDDVFNLILHHNTPSRCGERSLVMKTKKDKKFLKKQITSISKTLPKKMALIAMLSKAIAGVYLLLKDVIGC